MLDGGARGERLQKESRHPESDFAERWDGLNCWKEVQRFTLDENVQAAPRGDEDVDVTEGKSSCAEFAFNTCASFGNGYPHPRFLCQEDDALV